MDVFCMHINSDSGIQVHEHGRCVMKDKAIESLRHTCTFPCSAGLSGQASWLVSLKFSQLLDN